MGAALSGAGGKGQAMKRSAGSHLRAAIAVALSPLPLVATLGLTACGGSSTTESTSPRANTALAAGEAIFRAGVFDGRPIPRSDGSAGGMMGGGGMGGDMMAGGCATCHGPDGRGRTTSSFSAPNIAYTNLTDRAGMLMPDGTRGPAYTDASIRSAVVQSTDPKGDKLARPMPQWRLSDEEWGALLTYLKTLR